MDFERARAELAVLRLFIDFVNRQVGVYSDCLSGFQGNKVRVERQIPRVQRPIGRKIEQGQPVIVWASVEDPSSPDIIHHRIIRADEFISANGESGFNEQQIGWSIIVFIFAYWDEEIRPEIARIRGVQPNDVTIDALGDLRILRKSIVHNAGVLDVLEYEKLRVMRALVTSGAKITLDHDQMHKLFALVKQAIGSLILQYTGHLPGAPKVDEIVDVAVSNAPAPRGTGGRSR